MMWSLTPEQRDGIQGPKAQASSSQNAYTNGEQQHQDRGSSLKRVRESPEPSPASLGAPAGYGRSCTNCSKAKCRCILRSDGEICERCHRLGKECLQMVSQRKRVAKKASSSRTAQLEEKLDDLVSILRASQQQAAPVRQSSQPRQEEYRQYAPQPCQIPTGVSGLDSLAMAASATKHQPSPSAVVNPTSAETDDLPEPTPAEAEIYLSKFRQWLTYFPFMYLSPDLTAAELREERPFLWYCIMNITSMSVPQQVLLKEKVRQELATRLVANHEPNMDLLQGLIVYLAWATINTGPLPMTKPFLVLYTQMAMSIAFEMGLVRSPTEEQYFTTCFKPWGARPPPPKLRTLEERRCLLSLWFLTSMLASFIGKLEPMRWTAHMDDCLEVLDRDTGFPSDQVLVALIKVQLIGDEAHKLLVNDVMGGSAGQTPSFMFRKVLMTRLQTTRDNFSSGLSSNRVLQSLIHATEIQVHSLGLFMQNIPEAQRIETMYACLSAVCAWYDLFFSIPLIELPGLPFNVFIQLSQSQVALYRLTTADDPAWDKQILRNTADLLVILDRTCARLEQVSEVYPQHTGGEETLFSKATKIMKSIKASWEPALAQNLSGLPTPSSQGATGGVSSSSNSGTTPQSHAQATTMNDPNMVLADPSNIDFNDVAWMTDVFGPWEF